MYSLNKPRRRHVGTICSNANTSVGEMEGRSRRGAESVRGEGGGKVLKEGGETYSME